ncbi:uncharacterized protein [Miscanthus floridulus]|uniref:uncharacterized protein n=1 Tax=Miscanthus floridulus TaxID=154761 RepID=UPI003458F878
MAARASSRWMRLRARMETRVPSRAAAVAMASVPLDPPVMKTTGSCTRHTYVSKPAPARRPKQQSRRGSSRRRGETGWLWAWPSTTPSCRRPTAAPPPVAPCELRDETGATIQHVAVAGHALAVVERDDRSDPAIGRVLPTGSWLKDYSLVLAAHLAADCRAGRRLRGATVVELGAGGTALPGVAPVACLGAARCVLTDVATLLPGLRANADAKGMSAAQADVRELRWGDRLQLEDDNERVARGVDHGEGARCPWPW